MLAVKKYNILGLNIKPMSSDQILEYIYSNITKKQKIVISTGNVHSLNLSYNDKWLRDFMNSTDLIRTDGQGLRVAAKILYNIDFPQRSTWADFGWDLFNYSNKNNYSIYFLGAKEGIAELAADRVRERYPDLNICGMYNGYFDKNDEHESNKVIEKINLSKADILIIGFGMPVQEKWIQKYRMEIDTPVVMTGGAVFDYISGNLERGPTILVENGFEWLGRFIVEPRRLWKRYIFGNLLFIIRLIFQKFNIIKR